MEVLQSSFDNFFLGTCGGGSYLLDMTSCGKSLAFDRSRYVNNPEVPVFDDSREDCSRHDLDDADSARLADEDLGDFPLSSYFFPILPFAYLCETSNTNDEIFRSRGTRPLSSSCISMQSKAEVDEDTALCRCQAWSQDSPRNPPIPFLSSLSRGEVKETLALADELEMERIGSSGSRSSSVVRVLHWDGLVKESSDIRPLVSEEEGEYYMGLKPHFGQ